MKKKDINTIGSIYEKILTEGAVPVHGGEKTIEELYSYGPENLRENTFHDESGRKLVTFYTKRPPNDSENDKLHNLEGPAVIFFKENGSADPEGTFYFVDNERISEAEFNSDKFQNQRNANTISREIDSHDNEYDFTDVMAIGEEDDD